MTACLEATGASCLAAESLCAEDFSHLANPQVWIHGAVQIFFSLGVGYGSIVAFGSYGSKSGNFVRSRASLRRLSTLVPDLVFDRGTRCHFCRSPDGRPPMPPVPRHLHRRRLSLDRSEVAIANCGTSILAGCVVFPVLGFLAQELHEPLGTGEETLLAAGCYRSSHFRPRTDPCISADSLDSLKSIGLSGTGLSAVSLFVSFAWQFAVSCESAQSCSALEVCDLLSVEQ